MQQMPCDALLDIALIDVQKIGLQISVDFWKVKCRWIVFVCLI